MHVTHLEHWLVYVLVYAISIIKIYKTKAKYVTDFAQGK